VDHRVTKNGKGWGIITLEDYDGSYEFRFFNDDYLKFRMYFNQNQFTFMRFTVREGWIDKNTGRPTDPRIQYLHMQQLQDVLSDFAKSLVIQFRLDELEKNVVETILSVFRKNKGNHPVTFEIYEIDQVQKEKEIVSTISLKPQQEDIDIDELEDYTIPESLEIEEELIPEPEQIKVLNHLAMDSRSVQINICKELLEELEKNQINFKLN